MPPLSKQPPTVLDSKPRNDNNRGSVVGLRASPRRDPRAQHRRSSRRPRCPAGPPRPSARRSNSPHACSACSSLARSTRQVKLEKTPPALRLKAAAAPLGSSGFDFRTTFPSANPFLEENFRTTHRAPHHAISTLFRDAFLCAEISERARRNPGERGPPGKGGSNLLFFFGEFRARSGGTSGATRERAARAIDRAQDVGGRRGP